MKYYKPASILHLEEQCSWWTRMATEDIKYKTHITSSLHSSFWEQILKIPLIVLSQEWLKQVWKHFRSELSNIAF